MSTTTSPVASAGKKIRQKRPSASAGGDTMQKTLFLSRLALIAAFLMLWEFATGRWIDPFWFSSPVKVARYIYDSFASGSIWIHLYATMYETIIGFLVGSLLGIVAGIILARIEFLAKLLDPIIVALNSIPRVALAPLFIIWFGIGPMSKIFLAATLVFFLTFYNTFSGILGVDVTWSNIARVMGASEWQIFRRVVLPAAMPWIITGLKMAVPFALIGAIIGEFMAASRGLGYRIQLNTSLFNTTGTLADIIVLMVIVMALNGVLSRIEARLLRWRPRGGSGQAQELA